MAEWIAGLLTEAGWEPQVLHRDEDPERANVVVRVPGQDRSLPGVLLHAHTDVVPVEAEHWNVPPFEGLVRDGYVYGRGANDMLNTVAAALHTLLVWGHRGIRPQRDVVVAFVADEEDAGHWGAEWLAEEHPELFEGVGMAFGEDGAVGEPMVTHSGQTVPVYVINAGERGTMHIRLHATGASGHGSRPTGKDAVSNLLRALHRILEHQFPLTLSEVVTGHYTQLAEALEYPLEMGNEDSMAAFCAWLGDLAGPMPFTIRPTATPTVLKAGYKVNVVPGQASADVDVRCPPGTEQFVEQTLRELIGSEVTMEFLTRGAPLQSPIQGPWWDAMVAAVKRFDPQARVVPGCMGGGTDNKAFAKLGVVTYGFTPAPADPEGRRATGYHGIDEKVPVSQVEGGAEWLRAFLETV